MARKETGIQFLARLGSRPSLSGLESCVFGKGPNCMDVIELYGEEGSGKSQMILHLVACCILPEHWEGVDIGGHSAGVIIIDTDYKFSILRLVSVMETKIVSKFEPQCMDQVLEKIESFIAECLKRLQIVQCSNSSQLLLTIHNLEKLVCDNMSISAIFIDTISEFYSTDKEKGGNVKSAQEVNMRGITAVLNNVLNTYKLTLFAVKSAVYKKRDNSECSDVLKKDVELDHSEFLCKQWQNLVTHRLIFKAALSRDNGRPVFIVGGDCVQYNTRFTITDAGIKFV